MATARPARSRRHLVTVTLALAIGLAGLALVTGGAAASESITDCTEIDEAGTYELENDLVSNETCIEITADDVVLDGNDSVVVGDELDGDAAGIFAQGVSNVTVHDVAVVAWTGDSSTERVGVAYNDVTDGHLHNVTAVDSQQGIGVADSSDVTLTNPLSVDGEVGLVVAGSTGTTVSGAQMDNNSVGIAIIDDAPDTVVESSWAGNNDAGVYATNTSGLVLDEVTVTENSVGIGLESVATAHVEDVYAEHNDEGVMLNQTTDVTVIEPVAVDNSAGVVIEDSTWPEVVGGHFEENHDQAIEIEDSSNATAVDNTIVNSGHAGWSDAIAVSGSEHVAVTHNVIDNATGTGIALTATHESLLESNYVNDTDEDGILLTNAHGNFLDGNDVAHAESGIVLVDANHNAINDTGTWEHDGAGVVLFGADDNAISNTSTVRNLGAGIALLNGATDNTIATTLASDTGDFGIIIEESTDNTIESTSAEWNDLAGIAVINESDRTTITNTDAVDNEEIGVAVLDNSSDVELDTIRADGNGNWSFLAEDTEPVAVTDMNIGASTAPDTTVSFEATDTQLGPAEQPASNQEAAPLERYFSAESLSEDAFLNVSLQYDQADVSDVNESTVRLWHHDGAEWNEIEESTVDTDQNVVEANLTENSTFGAFGESDLDPAIDECADINAPGSYYLESNLTNDDTCITISADDVHLDGNGHEVTGEAVADGALGISAANVANVTVGNVSLSGWGNESVESNALWYDRVTDGSVVDVEIRESGLGIGIADSTNTAVHNLTATNNVVGAVLGDTSNSVISQVTATNNQAGVSVIDGHSIEIDNATTSENMQGVALVNTTESDVTNATAVDNGELGILVVEGDSATVADSQVSNSSIGVGVGAHASNTTVEQTTVTESEEGVLVDNASDTSLNGLTAQENDVGLTVQNGSHGTHVFGGVLTDNEEAILEVENATATSGSFIEIGESAAPGTLLSFDGTDASIDTVDDAPENPHAESIDRFVEVTERGTQTEMGVGLHYSDDDIESLNESSLALWAHDGEDWTEVPDSTIDEDFFVVTGTIEENATVGVFGQPAAPDAIVYEKTIENDGSIHTLGIPGPMDGSLADMFPEGTEGISAIYEFDDGGWNLVTDFDRQFDALDALVLVTDGESGDVPVEVRIENDTVASEHQTDVGWNYVSGTAFTGAEESFGVDSALVVLERYSHGTSTEYAGVDRFGSYVIGSTDWGAEEPTVNPFAGYFVFFEDAGSITPALSDVSDRSEADQALGIDE